ncbi:MAG: hypothetical protein K2O54_07455, partial [Prevotella sp.]|nr:hypothetical protein [Prevotella sp.]
IYTEDIFKKEKPDIISSIEKYNKNIRRFLFYPWGIWVTAYARANLFSGIIALGDDYIYSDTDSVKSLNTQDHRKYFDYYNNQIMDKIKRASEYHGIEIEKFSPLSRGISKPIGVWEDEGEYLKFKTIGSKRYLTLRNVKYKEFEENGVLVQLNGPEYVLTLAGANKLKTMGFLRKTKKPFENFDNDLIIPSEYSGRLTLTYIDEETEGDIVDIYGTPYHYHELSSIHMEPSEYHLTMTEEYINYLEGRVDFGE